MRSQKLKKGNSNMTNYYDDHIISIPCDVFANKAAKYFPATKLSIIYLVGYVCFQFLTSMNFPKPLFKSLLEPASRCIHFQPFNPKDLVLVSIHKM